MWNEQQDRKTKCDAKCYMSWAFVISRSTIGKATSTISGDLESTHASKSYVNLLQYTGQDQFAECFEKDDQLQDHLFASYRKPGSN